MAATTSGALKATIESLGLGITAYRDEPPEGQARPYVTITEEIAMAADPPEDGKAGTVAETIQVDIWQDWHDATTGTLKESYTLAPAVRRGIDGSRLSLIGSSVVYVALVRHSMRMPPDPKENIVRNVLQVEVWRQA